MKKCLVSTRSGEKHPFDRRAEFADNGESLEAAIYGLERASVRTGLSIWQRFADFLPFQNFDPAYSLGEGNTPLLESKQLAQKLGLDSLLLKIVQAANNSPLVSAFKQKKKTPIPFTRVRTIATAITTGNPPGGEEILEKAYQYDWLAEEATEEEILTGQKLLGEAGFFVEPSSAVSIPAIRKLRQAGKIERNARIVAILTGSGLKDTAAFSQQSAPVIHSSVSQIESDLRTLLINPLGK